jgi:hypothetical protein
MDILTEWNSKILNQLVATEDLILESTSLSKDYEFRKSTKFDIGFNVFKLSSDLYYRENFQSDIICALLNPNNSHNENYKFLHLFIDLLNKINPKSFIRKSDFQNAKVEREPNRIDILVTDSASKKALIIENKINDADDTYRQLPRYVEIVSLSYEIEAIAYITSKSSKFPNTFDWTEEEKNYIFNILKIIPSFDLHKNVNLYQDWVVPCIVESTNIDSAFILRQYGGLIKHLNINSMDTVILEKFHATILDSEKLKTAMSIRSMLNDLPEYLAIKIENKYKKNCYPFKSVWRYKTTDTVFEGCEIGSHYLKMDIWCSEDGYKVQFWNPNNPNFDIFTEFASFEPLKEFVNNNNEKNNVCKSFSLNAENELYTFIDKLISELKNRKNT